MVEKPLPDWVKERILQKVQNKALAQEAFKYISVVEKEDGTIFVKENFDKTDYHALWFMVLACVNYAQRLLRGEDID
ncbi:hypothetical protein [Aquifex aeolicus]|uniref:hypothetical protein n=1 Tax=Aquifex aeolicus TaxID=63363 RepID=UPI0002F861DE|nr:hypothetical protein [Aquifex aeolicus]